MDDITNRLVEELEAKIASLESQIIALQNVQPVKVSYSQTLTTEQLDQMKTGILAELSLRLQPLEQALSSNTSGDDALKTKVAELTNTVALLNSTVNEIVKSLDNLSTKQYVQTYVETYLNEALFGRKIDINSSIFGYEALNTSEVLTKLTSVNKSIQLDDAKEILNTYDVVCKSANVNPYILVAQMFKETDWLRSWWSQVPRRNMAGIGVTGETAKDTPKDSGWAFDTQLKMWKKGYSFNTWKDAIEVHIGHVLAYFLTDSEATEVQKKIIYTSPRLPIMTKAGYRGIADKITDLNGKYASPGIGYGESIINLATVLKQL